MAPTHGAVGEDVEKRRAVGGDRLLDLSAQVEPVGTAGLAHVRNVVGDGDGGHILALLRLAEALEADRAGCRARTEGVAPERWTLFMYASLS